ncbi:MULTISPECIES: hypothetical protein [Vibrio]|uniref:Uncharacterized protein n=1 Tax=Vibrio harveyi TaxID=669 RepID=A0A454D1C5_VIBHA|nr:MULTISPECIES: hypothetical protein [Vibrio]EKM32457.1 hypothetical protein VCHENC02_1984 [Vibrio harveyi]EKO3785692.1 hypothetical protein [Vibrio harveyi]EKO3844591.1 hypothetical protein [Vibrio harveyi]ELI0637274.1 hypothetical protein [Vibrio harveyi]RCR61401.1 hypothetical protein DTW68_18490 [Vibrio harveyi]
MVMAQETWGGIWDGVLETGGELLTDVTDIGKDWLGIKLQNEAQRVESSNPDEQRKHNNDYQQPTGEPVSTSAFAGVNMTYVAMGAVLLLVLLLVVFATKGKK